MTGSTLTARRDGSQTPTSATARRLRVELAHAVPDHEPLVERIAVLEELPRERLLDDDHRRRQLVVSHGERATALHCNLEHLEVAGRYREPGAAAVRRAIGERTSLNHEAEAVAPFERHAARRAGEL